MTVALTPDAQSYLERYLRQMKAALRGHPSVDAGEVERDVVGHIDAELAGQPEPIGAQSLREVLERLGAPDTWVPSEDLAAWRRVLHRLRSGPEDWRLAYLSFALFIAGPLLFMAGPFLWPMEPLLVAASFVMARASLAVLADHDEPVGARRWFIYPPLVVFYLVFALVLFTAPLLVLGATLDAPSTWQALVDRDYGPFEIVWILRPSAFVLGCGLWWAVLGLLALRFTGAVRVAFRPFAEWFDRTDARRLALTGVILALTSAVILLVNLVWA